MFVKKNKLDKSVMKSGLFNCGWCKCGCTEFWVCLVMRYAVGDDVWPAVCSGTEIP